MTKEPERYRMMTEKDIQEIKTFGQLKAAGYTPKTVKEELRENLIRKLRNGDELFTGIIG